MTRVMGHDDDGSLATCQEIGRQAKDFYRNRRWEDVEPLARRVWESQRVSKPWDEVAPTVRSVFGAPGV